jgi:hypothetical protein
MRAAVRKALKALEDAEGRLTPKAVVRAAANPESPLHPLFEWDDSKAADRHRLDQARTLIRSVQVEYRTTTQTVTSVAYVHDPSMGARQQGYRSVEKLREDPDDAHEALAREFRAAAGHLRRARQLAVPLTMEVEVDDLLDSLTALSSRLWGGIGPHDPDGPGATPS